MFSFTFGPWDDASEDATAVRALLQHDDIWEPQRRDGDSKEIAKGATFPNAHCAVFRPEGEPIGYILFTPERAHGVYQQHTAFLEQHRGAIAIRFIELAIIKLFIETDAIGLLTYCPEWHRASSAMARRIGGTIRYKKENFAQRDGRSWSAEVYGMTILEWAWQKHGGFAEYGNRWHEQVFATLAPHHDEDETHDGFLGIALKVGERRPIVGMEIYNAWAGIAGYAPGRVIWADGKGNSLIDIVDAVVVNSADAKVVAVFPKCPPLPPSEPS